MSSSQDSRPLDPVMQKPIVQLSFQILHRLKHNRTQAHLDHASYKEYGIECGQLDLSNGGDFLQLNTPEEMQQLASQYGFDNLREMETDPTHPFSNSGFVSDHLYSHLHAFKEDTCLADQTKWDIGIPDDYETPNLLYIPTIAYWKVECLSIVKDSSMPHVNCVLADKSELDEKTLMTSEVWSLLMLTLLFFRKPQNQKYEIVPVTIVTISGTTYRIVQGFVDGKEGKVRMDKSEILTIGPDRKNVTERMTHMVRWILAEPVMPAKYKSLCQG
ncbi:hypothetical protein O1611_g5574 [Lasiodiplodia mahajangana]|uniref:Uncharacterized protein n=1 Tax=Lasiodiplodia mahajangana TaxID=1108764 RepID=A0ACC2JKK8_9PEZI|nr:hypothetical protein O1611_g5574 [Lasiodiplodia mahajangana]